MGRKKRWPERVGAKFAAGTLDRIAAALADGEERTAFIREAVERELERREKAAAKTIPQKRRQTRANRRRSRALSAAIVLSRRCRTAGPPVAETLEQPSYPRQIVYAMGDLNSPPDWVFRRRAIALSARTCVKFGARAPVAMGATIITDGITPGHCPL